MAGKVIWCLLALLIAAPAYGQSRADPDCGDDRGVDRCAAAQQARVRALFGVGTIEAHRDAGDQVRRAFYVDGYGRDVVAITFVRRPGHDPEVRVHFKRQEGLPDLAPLVAPVPADAWELLIERSKLFDRTLVPLPEPARAPSEEPAITLCMHSWVYTVEATDPPPSSEGSASLRRRTEDACTHGVTGAFAREVYLTALPLFPHCVLLNAADYRTPANQLAVCGGLTGDRPAAAHVRNRSEALFDADSMADLPSIAALFNYRAEVDWNNERPASQDTQAVARFFLSKMLEAGRGSFYLERIEGLSNRRARLRGGFVRFVAVPGQNDEVAEIATAQMIWEAEYGNNFQIRSVTVGPFTRLPQP